MSPALAIKVSTLLLASELTVLHCIPSKLRQQRVECAEGFVLLE